MAKILLLLASLVLAMMSTYVQADGLRPGFYLFTCPIAESIVKSAVESHFRSNPAVAPKLLRMHFHDCFVKGCDASILVDGQTAEKTAVPNLSLAPAFPVIDDAKAQLEAACPGVVSCADIVALAARDAVLLMMYVSTYYSDMKWFNNDDVDARQTNGLGWPVLTGRRDGRVSLASDTASLPSPFDSIDVQKQKFSNLGLDTQDLVTLVGGHTIGTAACQFFRNRLYNFNNTNGTSDPTISPSFLPQLEALCPQNGDGNVRVDLDTGSGNSFDTAFYANLMNGRGILDSDQKLWTDASTRAVVQRFLGIRGLLGLTFNVEFGKSMVKMGNIGVLTGSNGEIRNICTAFN
ncbi:hypothetical protein MLD38_026918 [Melastoma candidum]|uniref:Uncharacterized protein n=1 Tax=Melastoma candidum TaxID=119954 RepID=A0ACB9P1M1_9MYRT|nr:hypothetical protein MLD38_026918 [Melastoma candidum]